MRMSHAFLVCVCLLGATQLAWSQTKAAAIPGYYNPTTGEFTTHIASSARPQPNAEAALTGTSIFFREEFNITISNYDQPTTAQAVCIVTMYSFGDSNGSTFGETASTPATLNGNTWTCDVPVLTLWTLQTPTTDSISATVAVDIYSSNSTVPGGLLLMRESSQSMTLAQPGNTQTAENSIFFHL
jgi:hypothetical protein